MTPNLLKNIPAASITFVVYENVLSLLQRLLNMVSHTTRPLAGLFLGFNRL
ncbi:hypothetical protein DsansV1_C12g0114341 [Dioscorea sansibarensis]